MDWGTAISGLSAIVAVISAIATYRESARMRTTSVTPVLVPGDFDYQFNTGAVAFSIINIGNGPARSITAEWHFDALEINNFVLRTQGNSKAVSEIFDYPISDIVEYNELFLVKDGQMTLWLPWSFERAIEAGRSSISLANMYNQPYIFPTLSLTVQYVDIFGKSSRERFMVRVEYVRELLFSIKFSKAQVQ